MRFALTRERVSEISLHNPSRFEGDIDVNFSSGFSFLNAEKTKGSCTLRLDIVPKNSAADFRVSVTCIGDYNLSGVTDFDTEKRVCQVIAKDYYPYLRSHVSSICTEASILPIYLPSIESIGK